MPFQIWPRLLAKEPLFHFLAGALLLFILFGQFNPTATVDGHAIQVTREKLLTYLEYKARSFERNDASDALSAMSNTELQTLVTGYVREEALYREARDFGLDQSDHVTRLRLVQQLEMITQGFVEAATDVSEDDVQKFYVANRSDYHIPAKITFTHVFLSKQRHEPEELEPLAESKLAELNFGNVPFHEAMRHGDRALYFVNYVDKEKDLVANHFGREMAYQLFALEPDSAHWKGPFESPYGLHLVLVTDRTEDRDPPLDEVFERVKADALAARRREQLDDALNAIVETYNVSLSDDLKEALGTKASGQ